MLRSKLGSFGIQAWLRNVGSSWIFGAAAMPNKKNDVTSLKTWYPISLKSSLKDDGYKQTNTNQPILI